MKKSQSMTAAALGIAALVATFTLGGAGAASAKTPDPSETAASSGTSCWLDADTGQSLCVPTGEDLIAAVQEQVGVSIALPPDFTMNGVSSAELRADTSAGSLATATTLIPVSEIFDDINYGGGYYLLSGTGCGATISNLANYGWNDRASSFKSFNGCLTSIWKNSGFTGTQLGYATNKSSFGSMNDQASSWATA